MPIRRLVRSLAPDTRDSIRQVYFHLTKVVAYLVAPIRLAGYYLRAPRSTWLHVGCGPIRLPGWINSDLHPTADLVIDVRRRLPFPKESLDRIYSEHVVEHLSCEEGLRFFCEARRVLKSGGVLRIAMPDLDELVGAYESDWRQLDWLSRPAYEFIQTRAEMINIAFRWWGHKYLYNREELERRLRQAGFSEISFLGRGESDHEELRGLEQRTESNLVAEATR